MADPVSSDYPLNYDPAMPWVPAGNKIQDRVQRSANRYLPDQFAQADVSRAAPAIGDPILPTGRFDPNAPVGKPTLTPVDYDPFEVAAGRTRRSVRPMAGRTEGALTSLPEDLLIPKTPLDAAVMVAGGPMGKLAKVGTMAAGAALTGSDAWAGPLGKLVRLLHGSPRTNLNFINPSERGPLGPGVYASEAEQVARHYAGPDGRLYEIPSEGKDIYRGAGHRTDAEWFDFKKDRQRLIDAAEPARRSEIAAIMDRMWSSDGYPAYQRIRSIYGSDAAAQDLYRRAGFHGISGLVDGPETVLFGPLSQPVRQQGPK